jgi:two-component system chemotaxis response regulator CheB
MDIKVLVVDDSALIRSLLSEIIRQEPGMQLVGAAQDAFVAKDMVMKFNPDVITLDIEMPKVDGLVFLDRLMKSRPTPVLMISTLTQNGTDATIKSLELGAIDFISKPKIDVANGLRSYQQEIVDKIRMAASSKPRAYTSRRKTENIPTSYKGTETIVGIGASTGGTEAIREVLQQLSPSFPATIITQHLPLSFTKSFANRLNSVCKINVKEAEDGERLLQGNAYIAPGDKHLKLVKSGSDYRIKLDDGPIVSGHKPSVDVMFQSMAETAGNNAVATILTGMGKDGASGMLSLRNVGALTMAQDEATSVIYGMPKAAVDIGATEHIFPLDKMSMALTKAVEKKGGGPRI